jgi:RecB family exonuclease
MPRILSPSAINLYFQCPRKFYYRYILRLPLKDSIHTVRGTLVHTILENVYDIEPQKLTNTNYRSFIRKYIKELLEKEWQNSKEKLDSLGLKEDEIDFYYKDTTQQLDKWLDRFLQQLEKKLKEVFLIKKAWEYFYPKHRELKIISEKYGVMGFIDQVLELNDRNLLIDFKTSAKANVSEEYELQLAVYNLLYKEKYGIEPETYLWFLKYGLKKVEITKKIIENTIKKIEIVKKALESENILDYQKNITPLCKWENARGSGQCDFYPRCFEQKGLDEI